MIHIQLHCLKAALAVSDWIKVNHIQLATQIKPQEMTSEQLLKAAKRSLCIFICAWFLFTV